MKAGVLRESITIEKPVTLKDSFGSTTITWENAITTRTKVTYNSGDRQTPNNEIFHTQVVTFLIRSYHLVSEDMRVIYKGKKYRILSISSEIEKQQITIKTELINE